MMQNLKSLFFKRLFRTQLRLNMVSGTMTMLLRMAILVCAYPIYIHYLGFEEYGIWVVLAIVLGLAQFGELGVGEAMTKLVAEAYGRRDVEEIGRYRTAALAILSISGLVLFVGTVVFRERIANLFNLTGDKRATVIGVLPYMGALSIYVFVVHASTAILSGLGRMDLTNYVELFGRVTSLVLSIVLLWMNWGVIALIVANTVSYVLIHLVSVFLAWRIAGLPLVPRATVSLASSRRLLHFGGGVLGITLLGMLAGPFNKIMITRYTGLSSVAIYELAHKAGSQIKALLNPAIKALMPEVSRLDATETPATRARIKEINLRTAKFMLLGGGAVYLGLLFGARPLLALWLRRTLPDVLPGVFRIVLTASFVSLLGGCAYSTLMGMGQVGVGLIAHVLKAGFNIAVVLTGVLLWPPLTLPTVAYAWLAASAAASLYLLLKMRTVVPITENPASLTLPTLEEAGLQ